MLKKPIDCLIKIHSIIRIEYLEKIISVSSMEYSKIAKTLHEKADLVSRFVYVLRKGQSKLEST